MRILHVITSLSTGGAEMMLYKLLSRMDGAAFDTRVICLTANGPIGKKIESLGIPVIALNMRRGAIDLLRFSRLVREIRHARVDVVQTWLYHADLLGGLAAHMAGANHVVWNIRNSSLDVKKSKWHTRMAAHACAMLSNLIPTQIVTNSNTAAALHQELGYDGGRIVVIPNGFDADVFRPDNTARASVRTELGLAGEVPLVGLIGRFDPQKNHAGFIRAAAQALRGRSDVRFVLCGRGVDISNGELMRLIGGGNLDGHIYLLGERHDIPRLTAALDVAVSSSCYGEAFPNVVGEAMSCGVPCVVTDVGDSAAIVGDTGKVVPPGDDAALTAALLAVLAMSQAERRALGMRARQRVIDLYSLDSIAQQYELLYEAVIGESK